LAVILFKVRNSSPNGERESSGRARRASWPRRPCSRLFAAALATALGGAAALAFDADFCIMAQQLATAAKSDIGLWTDRVTRNAGMVVSCNTKVVTFRRFTYASTASMDEAWKEKKSGEWNAAHCGSPLWRDAIRNGWKIVLSTTSADGGTVSLNAQCK
jgi:hypothetical protein